MSHGYTRATFKGHGAKTLTDLLYLNSDLEESHRLLFDELTHCYKTIALVTPVMLIAILLHLMSRGALI